ncbi:hypothetical protein Hypma_013406 [Hypsizygus marmoreus]|uniref:EKC/KEOPS complex subunit GON7 n=1 Tax=Hypsizygus marmoreus TaxID=39966 RepID=A0A369JJ94_HYPMA|nr:hypothetical protein Hypma_013406 [Hypsizygus marmoreus]
MSSAAASIKISYQLNPPAQTNAGDLSASKTQEFPVNATPAEGQEKYYNSLQKTIIEAKDRVGNELTAWRDAVGKAELSKETPKTLKYDAGEEVEDDDE